METSSISQQESPGRGSVLKLFYCAGVALFLVVFAWGFWDHGPLALGFNACVFLALLFSLFIGQLQKAGKYEAYDLSWIIPIGLIIASFAVYDNPFLKMLSIPVVLGLFAVFYNHAFLTDKRAVHWNFYFALAAGLRILSLLQHLNGSMKTYLAFIMPPESSEKRVFVRIVAGLVIFLVIALTIIIPLLSSADLVFLGKMQVATEWLQNIFSASLIGRAVVFIILSISLLAALTAWEKPFEYAEKEEGDTRVDSIIVGIVLSGVLCIYLFFLWIQFNRLWIGALPIDFRETEQLVKSGFWQLLGLSVINILIYFFAYKKTVSLAQKLLSAFTVASLLLLASAGLRMGLYVTYYGFSYEKFFASYTVLYCAILFVWLIAQLFRNRRANIVKFLVMLFLWMFALLSLFPVEQFIFRANMALYHLKDSRLALIEMKMLSSDVLLLVKKNKEKGMLEGDAWNAWIERQERIVSQKTWYERNIMNMVYALSSSK